MLLTPLEWGGISKRKGNTVNTTAARIKPGQYVRFANPRSFTGSTEGAVTMVHTSPSGWVVLTYHPYKQNFLAPDAPVEVLGTFRRKIGGGVSLI